MVSVGFGRENEGRGEKRREDFSAVLKMKGGKEGR